MKKPSFFSRLTGGDSGDDYFDSVQPGEPDAKERHMHMTPQQNTAPAEFAEGEGELAVDVYQTDDFIVVKAFLAGVQPNSIDISLTRDMLTVSGTREDEREVSDEGYFQRELFWGAFTRTVLLPEEVDVDLAEASEKHGVLMIRLPKINKKKETKLKVRSR